MVQSIISILAGVASIYVFQLFFSMLSLLFHIPKPLPIVLSYCAVFIGGVLSGWIVKKQGFLYGGLSAAILGIVYIVLNTVGFLFPVQYSHTMRNAAGTTMLKNIVHIPFDFLLAGVGGWFGEKLFHQKYAT